jgi:hypothetical protein
VISEIATAVAGGTSTTTAQSDWTALFNGSSVASTVVTNTFNDLVSTIKSSKVTTSELTTVANDEAAIQNDLENLWPGKSGGGGSGSWSGSGSGSGSGSTTGGSTGTTGTGTGTMGTSTGTTGTKTGTTGTSSGHGHHHSKVSIRVRSDLTTHVHPKRQTIRHKKV